MPLRDHFRGPVFAQHSWDELHGMWPGEIVRALFPLLPTGYQAKPKIHLGSSFEIDVGTFELDLFVPEPSTKGQLSTQFAPTLTIDAELSDQDEYAVRIYDEARGRRLVATVEILNPSNKDRPESRELFLGKVQSLLREGVSVSIVDLVTTRRSNLYAELLSDLDRADPILTDDPSPTYTVTLRNRRPGEAKARLDTWYRPLAIGDPLPEIPIWLSTNEPVLLPLETCYEESCRLLHIV